MLVYLRVLAHTVERTRISAGLHINRLGYAVRILSALIYFERKVCATAHISNPLNPGGRSLIPYIAHRIDKIGVAPAAHVDRTTHIRTRWPQFSYCLDIFGHHQHCA